MGQGARARAARRRVVLALSGLVVLVLAGTLFWFQPWKLWTDHVVDEPLPRIAPTAMVSAQGALLADGQLISHEHQTTGSVELIRLADGHRVLTVQNLRTSNGPALHVWLSDAPVLPGSQGWRVFDDHLHLDLGELKGNIGNQMYPVGDEVDLDRYTSVTIWCDRFSVSFGAAELSSA